MTVLDMDGKEIDSRALVEYSEIFASVKGVIQPAVQYVSRLGVLEKEFAKENEVVFPPKHHGLLLEQMRARINALHKAFSDRYVVECDPGDMVLYESGGGFSVAKYVADDMLVTSIDSKRITEESRCDKVLCVMEDTLDLVVADDTPLLLERGQGFMLCGFAETYQQRLYVKRWPGDMPVGYPAFTQDELDGMDKVSSLAMKLRGPDVVDLPYR